MLDLSFSFKKTKDEVIEKYPNTPVLTFTGDSGYAKFQLNKKACELLKYAEKTITAKISYAKDNSNEDLLLVNTTGSETDNQSNIFADNSFANKKFYTRLSKKFNIEPTNGDEFPLEVPNSEASFPVIIVTNNVVEVEEIKVEEVKVEEISTENVSDFGSAETAFETFQGK